MVLVVLLPTKFSVPKYPEPDFTVQQEAPTEMPPEDQAIKEWNRKSRMGSYTTMKKIARKPDQQSQPSHWTTLFWKVKMFSPRKKRFLLNRKIGNTASRVCRGGSTASACICLDWAAEWGDLPEEHPNCSSANWCWSVCEKEAATSFESQRTKQIIEEQTQVQYEDLEEHGNDDASQIIRLRYVSKPIGQGN